MSHIDESNLRRLVDEPLAISEVQRRHLESCGHCRSRAEAVAIDARRSAELLATPDAAPDVEAALARVRAVAGREPARGRPGRLDRVAATLQISPGRLLRPAGAVALAGGLMAVLVVSGAAQSVLDVFQPRTVAPVAVSPQLASFRGLPDLSAYGTLVPLQDPKLTRAQSQADAAAQSGLRVLAPATLPRDAAPSPFWYVLSRFSGSFTFSAARAAQAASAGGRTLPAGIAGLDGATLTVEAGPGVLTGWLPKASTAPAGAAGAGASGGLPATRAAGAGGDSGDLLARLPELVVGQMTAPKVTTTRVSVRQLEAALLSLPGVPQSLRAQIQAIGDPTSVLPIPIPTQGMTSKQVQVQGVQAVALGDNTGIGSGVIWIKDGQLFVVAGQMSMNEVVAVARSLH